MASIEPNLQAWWRLLRPAHWIKSGVCLAPILFYGQYQNPHALLSSLLVMLCFILVSSTVYIINDIADFERDRMHPKNKFRPIASGQISVKSAWVAAFALAVLALILSFWIQVKVGACCAGYLAINLAYSRGLKHLPVADAFCIALGFVLRLLAGIYVLDLLPTIWLTMCTFFLSLFLGFAKRRAERVALEDLLDAQGDSSQRRPVLDHYSLSFLDGALDTSAALAILCYALFIGLPAPTESSIQQNPSLVVTVPFVVFMILHYRRRLTHPRYRIEPNRIVFNDRIMQACAALWLITYLAIQHSGVRWFQ